MNIKKMIRWIRIIIILNIFISTLLLNGYYFIKFWIILYYIELNRASTMQKYQELLYEYYYKIKIDNEIY